MSRLRLITSGESHGKVCLAVVEGFPAGVKVDEERINEDLHRRQGGYGRGGRMRIETDKVEMLTGVRKGRTMGGPVTMAVWNKDFRLEKTPEVTKPRPGHSDLAGYLKYNTGIREILERASARETAVRVAAGSLAKLLLREFDVEVLSHVVRIGPAALPDDLEVTSEMLRKIEGEDGFEVRCVHEPTAQAMIEAIKQAKKAGDTRGGVYEIIVNNVPVGLGSHAQWDRKLDGRIAQACMSIQAMKAVEIGMGVGAATQFGSEVHDSIHYDLDGNKQPSSGGYYRGRNSAGGIEGGMSNGSPIHVRVTMKPISTLMKPIQSVDVETKEAAEAAVERSDHCAVPAASVVGECVVAFTIADAFVEKFGGDSLDEIKRNHAAYMEYLKSR